MRADFAELHKRRFGYMDDDAEVIVDALVVEAVGILPRFGGGGPRKAAVEGPPPSGRVAYHLPCNCTREEILVQLSSSIHLPPRWSSPAGAPNARRTARLC